MQRGPTELLGLIVATLFVGVGVALLAIGEPGAPLEIVLFGWTLWMLVRGRAQGALLPCALAVGLAFGIHHAAGRPIIDRLGAQQAWGDQSLYTMLWGAFCGAVLGAPLSVVVHDVAPRLRAALGVAAVVVAISASGAFFWSEVGAPPTAEDALRALPLFGTLEVGDRVFETPGLDVVRDGYGRIAVLEPGGDPDAYVPAACERLSDAPGALEVRRIGALIVVTPEGGLDQDPIDGCAFDLRGRASVLASALTGPQEPRGLEALATLSAELAAACLLLAFFFAQGLRRSREGDDAISDGRGHVRTEDGRSALLLAPAGPVVVQLHAPEGAYRAPGLTAATLVRRGTRGELETWHRERLGAALSLALGLALLAAFPAAILVLEQSWRGAEASRNAAVDRRAAGY